MFTRRAVASYSPTGTGGGRRSSRSGPRSWPCAPPSRAGAPSSGRSYQPPHVRPTAARSLAAGSRLRPTASVADAGADEVGLAPDAGDGAAQITAATRSRLEWAFRPGGRVFQAD